MATVVEFNQHESDGFNGTLLTHAHNVVEAPALIPLLQTQQPGANLRTVGRSIKQDQLKAGDMVFFKTGFKARHVGMYIDKGDFLHVSSSKGVMISNMDHPYWSSAYWKARRLQ